MTLPFRAYREHVEPLLGWIGGRRAVGGPEKQIRQAGAIGTKPRGLSVRSGTSGNWQQLARRCAEL